MSPGSERASAEDLTSRGLHLVLDPSSILSFHGGYPEGGA